MRVFSLTISPPTTVFPMGARLTQPILLSNGLVLHLTQTEGGRQPCLCHVFFVGFLLFGHCERLQVQQGLRIPPSLLQRRRPWRPAHAPGTQSLPSPTAASYTKAGKLLEAAPWPSPTSTSLSTRTAAPTARTLMAATVIYCHRAQPRSSRGGCEFSPLSVL